jgi:type III restriction enzyme
MPTRVRSLEDRISCEITFPRLNGYRYELATEKLQYVFNKDSRYVLTTADLPSKTENAPIVGESTIHKLDDLINRREQEVVFLLSKLVLEKYFREDSSETKPWLFPQILSISKQWIEQCVTCKDNTFIQMLLLVSICSQWSRQDLSFYCCR